MSDEDVKDAPYAFVLPKWVRHSNRPISSVDIHPSGEIFATGGWDNYVKIWNFEALLDPANVKNKLIALLRDHTCSINCVRFSPDGRYLASCGDDGMVFLWQRVRCIGQPSTFGIPDSALRPNKPVQRWSSRAFTGNTGDVSGISWCSNSQRIASCSIDGVVIVWDVKTGMLLSKTRMPIGSLGIAWDPLDRFIVVQSLDSHLVLLDSQGSIMRGKSDMAEFLDSSEQSMTSRIAWSPDGSFIGAPGYKGKHFTTFFQRETFNFAFALEGHIAPITCVAFPPFLLKMGEKNYASLCATVDKSGVLAIWVLGGETKPVLVIDNISSSTAYDLAWSKDGKWLFIALESDPVSRSGGLLCLRILKELEWPKADPGELEDVQGRLLGEATFKMRSAHSARASEILQSLEVKEKEVDLEVLQLTTEEVLKRQIETIVDGKRTIQPVLLTAVEKQMISFQCNVSGVKPVRVPHEMWRKDLGWKKPAAMSAEPSKVVELEDCLIVASEMTVFKLSKDTGRRLSTPFVIGGLCRHLSVENGVVLAVGKDCFVLDLKTMRCLFSCECPSDFSDFGIVSDSVIIGQSLGKVWMYDRSIQAWVGGVLTNSPLSASMADVEKYAEWNRHESAASQWFDFGISALFSAYAGEFDQLQKFLEEMKAHDERSESKDFIARIESVIQSRWQV